VYVDDEKKKMERPKTAKQTLNETVTNVSTFQEYINIYLKDLESQFH